MPSDLASSKRIYLPTVELYSAGKSATGIVPAFNNVYDVWINFDSTVPDTNVGGRTGASLLEFINQHGFYDQSKGDNPGDYLALFCSEAVLPGSQFETSEVRGLRQGVSSNYAIFRTFPDVSLTFYSQKDYYTNDVFNAWMEYISPTQLRSGGFGSNSKDRLGDKNSYRRMKYPKRYKCDIQITAFNNEMSKVFDPDEPPAPKTIGSSITYYLQNAFPVNIVAAPLAYGDAELIKTTVTFKYDCYYIDRTSKAFDTNVVTGSDEGINVRNPF